MPTFSDLNLLNCTNCMLDVYELDVNSDSPQPCPHCNRKISVHLFPSLVRNPASETHGGQSVIGSESSCYYHPNKSAKVVCDGCGRFLCGLCDIDERGAHQCPGCIERAIENSNGQRGMQRLVRYDTLSLIVCLVGIPLFWMSFITSTISLYYVVRHWRTPLSVQKRYRWRFILAGLFSLGILAGWVFLILGLISGSMT